MVPAQEVHAAMLDPVAQLTAQIKEFTVAVAAFQIEPMLRYAIQERDCCYADPRFTAALMGLFSKVDLNLLKDNLTLCNTDTKKELQQALSDLLKKFNQIERVRSIEQNSSRPEHRQCHGLEGFWTDRFNKRYLSLESFRQDILSSNGNYMLAFRGCFPIDPSYYSKLLEAEQCVDWIAAVEIAKKIADNINKIKAFYDTAFELINITRVQRRVPFTCLGALADEYGSTTGSCMQPPLPPLTPYKPPATLFRQRLLMERHPISPPASPYKTPSGIRKNSSTKRKKTRLR